MQEMCVGFDLKKWKTLKYLKDVLRSCTKFIFTKKGVQKFAHLIIIYYSMTRDVFMLEVYFLF